jgi:hypothetical protein
MTLFSTAKVIHHKRMIGMTPKVMVELLSILLRIWKALGSNLALETGCP